MFISRFSSWHKLVLLFLVPILAYVESMRDAYRKSSQVVITLFCGLYGWLCGPYNEQFDLYRYIEKANLMFWSGDAVFYRDLAFYMAGEANIKDFYFQTIVYCVSFFSTNYHYVFLIIGLVYGFFYAKTYSIIINHITRYVELNRYYNYILFVLFVTLPFTSLGSVRFWTATWISLYVILKVFLEKRYFYILLLPLTIFIHGSFVTTIILIIVSILLSFITQSTKILTVMAFVSIPFSYLSTMLGDIVLDYTPNFLQKTVSLYFSEKNLSRNEVQGSGFSIVTEISNQIISTFRFVLMAILLYFRLKVKDDYSKLYICILVFLVFANFTMAIPSVGGRYAIFAFVLLLFLWCVTFRKQEYSNIIKWIPIVYSFMFVYWIYWDISGSSGLTGLFIPPIISFVRFM